MDIKSPLEEKLGTKNIFFIFLNLNELFIHLLL